VAVPIDYRASPSFLARVSQIVKAKLLLIGQDVPPLDTPPSAPVWKLHELDWTEREPPAVPIARDDVVEIIFTSGATADPKGVVITHRNVLANIVPVEREVLKYRTSPRGGRALLPDSVSESPALEPHVRPGDGHLHPADAPAASSSCAATTRRRSCRRSNSGGFGAGVGAEDSRGAPRVRRAQGSRSAALSGPRSRG
jgi:hypothetical protein